MTGSEAEQVSASARIDTGRPHPARVYDWWLGGKDNSQVTADLNPEAIGKAAENFRRGGTPFHPRSLAEFTRFFEGLELLGPGVIPVSGWRPDPEDVAAQAEGIVPVYAGVARKP